MESKVRPMFGATIRRLREERQLSLRKLAKLVGMSPTYLSKVERDEFAPPSEEKVLAIAQALDQDPDEMLAWANRVSSDLAEAIKDNPRDIPDLIRIFQIEGLTPEQGEELTLAMKMTAARFLEAADLLNDDETKAAGE